MSDIIDATPEAKGEVVTMEPFSLYLTSRPNGESIIKFCQATPVPSHGILLNHFDILIAQLEMAKHLMMQFKAAEMQKHQQLHGLVVARLGNQGLRG